MDHGILLKQSTLWLTEGERLPAMHGLTHTLHGNARAGGVAAKVEPVGAATSVNDMHV